MVANTRILLAARPDGPPRPSDFRIEDAPIPEPAEGQILLRVLYLSLDPYMRGRMSAAESYAAPVEIGAVMEGAPSRASSNPGIRAMPRVISCCRIPAGRPMRCPTARG